jgi:hypothetical protein
MTGVIATVAGSLGIAAVSSLGDFIWAAGNLRHRPEYGLTHGTLLFLAVGLFLGVLARRPAAGAMWGAALGFMAAGSFYVLAPMVGYSAMFVVWIAIWLGLAVWLAIRTVRVFREEGVVATVLGADPAQLCRLAGAGVILAHFGYYTLIVGGDHFEYRIYHHLVPLLMISLPWICERLGLTPRRALTVLVTMLVLGWPIPWIHWAYTHNLDERVETRKLRYSVAPHLPLPVRWYGMAWKSTRGNSRSTHTSAWGSPAGFFLRWRLSTALA